MTREELIEYALTYEDAAADCPFENDEDSVVLRHKSSGKWFGLIMNHGGEDIVNLKCEVMNGEFLRSVYKGVTPAYHMNKTHWNTVYLSSDVPDDEIKNMVGDSFELTRKGKKRNERKERN
jgi:predicted DNA-binding protein (MmcQ/YjbR family)